MTKPITLVWDIDDVLNRLTHEWLEHGWRAEHPGCRVSYEELSANPPHHALGVPLKAYLDSLDAFRESPRGLNLSPTPETVDWFSRHGDRFRHIALTARPMASAPAAAEWVVRHYGRWIRAFGFVPSPRPDELLPPYASTKGEWLRWIGTGDVLIDDSLANLADARAEGLLTFAPPQPWNGQSGSLSSVLEQLTAALPLP